MLMGMSDRLDCVVCGSCVVDLLCRPVSLEEPIGSSVLHPVESVVLTGGGITINSGVAMARLGMKVGVMTYIGDDSWAPVVHDLFREAGIDDTYLMTHPTESTSTTVVMVDGEGERSFFHCVGAPEMLDANTMLERIDLFARSNTLLLGYYSLMPNLESALPDVLARIRAVGCRTALDAAGAGGTMDPLERILPHLDFYVPSLTEASHQTGLADPEQIIRTYRGCAAPGLLGVKLGKKGVLLSPRPDEYVHIDIVDPPGAVIDTTGAGDCFYAGLLTGLIKGQPIEQAGRLGAAAAACCVTAIGGAMGVRDYAITSALAGLA